RAGEVLLERADPAETRGDRVGVGTDVVPVKRVADLEPQRVARPEPAWNRATLEHAVPQCAGDVGRDEKLDPELARVAGPVDRARHAVDFVVGKGERRRIRKAEPLD